jgi:ppGpp synthetase/RelA/SpoT-type nucleotidyltranferase
MFDSFDNFFCSALIQGLRVKYKKRSLLAFTALKRLKSDINDLKDKYEQENRFPLISSFSTRTKSEESFFRKLYRKCIVEMDDKGYSEALVKEHYEAIKDVAGARLACQYAGDVIDRVKIIRDHLKQLGYATQLKDESFKDKDFIKNGGDQFGYRSYHFYVRIPAITNIYGGTENIICEIQARSELQQVWADKSHDLLYKNNSDIEKLLEYKEDMRQLSNQLESVDHFFDNVRKRIKSNSDNPEIKE